MRTLVLDIAQIAGLAGWPTNDGRLNLPNTQVCADSLARATQDILPWEIGQDPWDLTLTGAGPVWAYLAIAHAAHGRAARLRYASPTCTIVVYSHGVPEDSPMGGVAL